MEVNHCGMVWKLDNNTPHYNANQFSGLLSEILIFQSEEGEHVSMLSDIVFSVELFGRHVAEYLKENNRMMFCPSGITNIGT